MNHAHALVSFTKLYMKLMQGMQYYQMGLFNTAKRSLQDADMFLTETLNACNATGTAMENLTWDKKMLKPTIITLL